MIKYEHLKGIEYQYGRRDCFALVRDFYRDNFGFTMRDYACPTGWHDNGELDLIAENVLTEGFKVVDFNLRDFQVGDLISMAMFTPLASHLAVYVGDGQILHHMMNRRSEVSPYRDLFINTTVAVYRHPAVKVDPPALEEKDIRDLMSPAARLRLEKKLAQLQP